MTWLEEARSEIRLIEKRIYLNNASSGPIPYTVAKKTCDIIIESALSGEPWDIFLETVFKLKRTYAEMVNADPEEIAYAPGVTYGLSTILSSIDLDKESNIVISELNFPTSIVMAYSMQRRGLVKEVRMVRDRGGYTDFNDYEEAVDDNTSVVLVDYVPWLSGYVEDLKGLSNLAHDHGALLISDMFHAAGVMPIDVKKLGVDIAITGSYKWLMSLHGAGLIYVSRNALDKVVPRYMGWLSIDDSVFQRRARGEDEFRRPFKLMDFEYPETASRLELGTPPIIPVIALYESINFLKRYGAPERFEGHTYENAEYLMNRLNDLGYELYTPWDRHASIVTIRHREPHKVVEKLLEEGIEVSARPGLIRISPHFYNTKEEIEQLIETIGKVDKQT